MALAKGAAKFLATKILESLDSGDVSHNDLQTWLADALCDYAKSTGQNSWSCYLVDFIGDGESGDVIFRCGGDLKKCGYSIETVNGKVTAQLDDDAVDVLPHTIYEEEADEADHYASMESARLYTKGAVPLCERMINKAARDAASAGSFAGKGKSFPILKAADVMAAVRSIGHAGSDNYDAGTLKRNIISIAKKKGFTSSLPKAWQEAAAGHDDEYATLLTEAGGNAKKAAQAMHDKGVRTSNQKSHDAAVKLGANCPDNCSMGDSEDDDSAATEAASAAEVRGVHLRESAALSTAFEFRESAAISPTVKIISPGRGSTGYYTKELLERDGPSVFKRGTLMFINHATAAESTARPEGDWTKLAAVTEADAKWMENGPDGPALYAPAAVFSKYAEEVREKAPYTGVSINAYGQYAESATGLPNSKIKFDESKIAPDGKPGLIGKLLAADSIDLVTKAGRDGKLLLESAAAPQHHKGGADDMDAAEARKLLESNAALLTEVKKMRERQFAGDAIGEVQSYLETVQVSVAVGQKVVETLRGRFALAGGIPLTGAGEIDTAKVKSLAESETKDVLAFLGRVSPGLVRGMGAVAESTADPKAQEKAAKESEKSRKRSVKEFAEKIGFRPDQKQGIRILREGRRAFNPEYNARVTLGAKPVGADTLTMERSA